MKRIFTFAMMILVIVVLSGCMYPQEKRQQLDQLPQHVARVQSAIKTYLEQNKVLPYKYVDDETKLTTKYVVDFMQLQSYVGDIPPTAFEKGGNYLYVLINVEKNPTVRLFDLRINDQIGKLQPIVTQYLKDQKSLPSKRQVVPGIYELDFEKLGVDPVTIPSPYSAEGNLPLLIDQKGKIYLDYRVEAMKKIQSASIKPVENQDLREWLGMETFFVPGFSVPMIFKGGEPVFVLDEQK